MKNKEDFICNVRFDFRPGHVRINDSTFMFFADWSNYKKSISYDNVKEILDNDSRKDVGKILIFLAGPFMIFAGLQFMILYGPVQIMRNTVYFGILLCLLGLYMFTRSGLDIVLNDDSVLQFSGDKSNISILRSFIVDKVKDLGNKRNITNHSKFI